MAEYTNAVVQTVQPNQDVLFSNTAVRGNCSLYHREGSGIVSLKGNKNGRCNQKARYEVDFSGNIAVAEGETVAPISLAIAIDGEPLQSAVGTVTPTAVGDFFNVSMSAEIEVPSCCCYNVSVRNINDIAIDVINSNLRIVRTA